MILRGGGETVRKAEGIACYILHFGKLVAAIGISQIEKFLPMQIQRQEPHF